MAVTSRFYIVKNEKEKKAKSFNGKKIEGYHLTTKGNVHFSDGIDISSIIITDPNLINKVATKKIKSKFDRLISMMQIVCEVGDEDESGEGYLIALNEDEKLRMELWNKYRNLISEKKLELMLKKIAILEDELKLRYTILMNSLAETEELEKGHSR